MTHYHASLDVCLCGIDGILHLHQRSEVLAMTLQLAAIDFSLIITHHLCHQLYVFSTSCLSYKHIHFLLDVEECNDIGEVCGVYKHDCNDVA